MADYAGAVAAIRARLEAGWTTTPIAFQNEAFDAPVDPNSGNPSPWAFLEVIGTSSDLRGVGVPGSNAWLYEGLIHVHVFVPVNSGAALAHQYAVTIGELFRAASFYADTPPNVVRTWAPRTDGGGTDADNGNWYRVTMTCEFHYYHRG